MAEPDGIARLAQALGLPEERVRAALASAGATPADLLRGLRAGVQDERLGLAAKQLRVDAARLGAALVDAAMEHPLATHAATMADGLAATLKGSAEEALSIGLEIVGETVPRVVNLVLAVLAVGGVALVAVGFLAILDTEQFLRLLALFAGLALALTGVLLFVLAWKLHEATATVRTVARVARKWRARRLEREAAGAREPSEV